MIQPAGAWPRLNNRERSGELWADCVKLLYGGDRLLDEVCYRGSWVRERGCSLERISAPRSGTPGEEWFCGPSGGTPCKENSYGQNAGSLELLRCSPEVVRIRGGESGSLTIVYRVSEGVVWIDIVLFDMRGRRVATVLRQSRAPGSAVFRWELPAHVLKLPTGVYVIVMRVFVNGQKQQASSSFVLVNDT